MRSLEEHWKDLERLGFIRSAENGIITYTVPPRLGNGSFILFGDSKRVIAAVTDVTFVQPLTLLENISEKTLSVGQFYTGAVDIYEISNPKLLPCEHGLHAFADNTQFSGFKRFAPHSRLVNVGFIFREQFFTELEHEYGTTLPPDFWETAARILNPHVITSQKLTQLCNHVKNCRLTGLARNVFMHGKCLETFSALLTYVYTHNQIPQIHLSKSDITVLEEIRNVLEREMLTPPSIKELSKRFSLNQQKLMQGFKQRYNMTIYSYIKRLRMEKALHLLQHDQLLISDIARRCGYKGEGHFQQVFFDTFGMLPLQTRKQLRSVYKNYQ